MDLRQEILLQLRAEGEGEIGKINAEMNRLMGIMKGVHDEMNAGNIAFRDGVQTLKQYESEVAMLAKRLQETTEAVKQADPEWKRLQETLQQMGQRDAQTFAEGLDRAKTALIEGKSAVEQHIQSLDAEATALAKAAAAAQTAAEEEYAAAIQQVRSHQQIVASLDALDAKVNQVFDDEQREAAEAAAAEEAAAIKQVRSHQQIMASMDSLNAKINSTLEADKAAAAAANVSTTEVFQRAHEAQLAAATAAGGMKNQFSGLAMGMMQVGYMIDDIQYGFGAIVNNIAPLGMSIATAFGASIPQAQMFAAAAQIGGVAVYQLAKNWDNLMDAIGTGRVRSEAEEMKELAKATERTADEEERYLKFKEREQAVKRQQGMRPKAEEESSKEFREAIAEGDRDAVKRGLIQTKRDLLLNRPEAQPLVAAIDQLKADLANVDKEAPPEGVIDVEGWRRLMKKKLQAAIDQKTSDLQNAIDKAANNYLAEAENNTEGRRHEFMNAMRANLGAFGPHAAGILQRIEESTPEKIKEKEYQEKRKKAERWLERRTKEDEEKMDQAERENIQLAKQALPGAEVLTQEAIRQRVAKGQKPEDIWKELTEHLAAQLREQGFTAENAMAAAIAINTEAGQRFGEQQAREVVQATKKEPHQKEMDAKHHAAEIKRHATEAATALMKNQGEGGLPMALARHVAAGESAAEISGALGPELRRQIGQMQGIPADQVAEIAEAVFENLLGKEQRAGIAMGGGAHLEQMEGRARRRGRQSQRQSDLEQVAEGMQQMGASQEQAMAFAPQALHLIQQGMHPLAASQAVMMQQMQHLAEMVEWLRQHQFNMTHQMSGVDQRLRRVRMQNPPLLPVTM